MMLLGPEAARAEGGAPTRGLEALAIHKGCMHMS